MIFTWYIYIYIYVVYIYGIDVVFNIHDIYVICINTILIIRTRLNCLYRAVELPRFPSCHRRQLRDSGRDQKSAGPRPEVSPFCVGPEWGELGVLRAANFFGSKIGW